MKRCLPLAVSLLLMTLAPSCHEGTKYTEGQQLSCDLSFTAGYSGYKYTKAIVIEGDAFVPVWKEGDAVAVYAFDKESNGQAMQIGTLKAGSEGVESILSGTVSFVYGDAIAGKIDMGDLSTGKILFVTPGDKFSLQDQKGKLDALQEKYGFRTAESKVFTIDLETRYMSLESASIRFTTPLSVLQISLVDWKGDPIAPARVSITAEDAKGEACLLQRVSLFSDPSTGPVNVMADGASSTFIAALYPTKSEALRYRITASAGALNYEGSIESLRLESGHVYARKIKMDRTVDLSAITSGFIAQDRDVLTGTGTYPFTIADGAIITLSGVDLTLQEGISCAGSTRIQLAEGTVNNIRSAGTGILAGPVGSSLGISGEGTLNVTAGATAIGGTASRDCGHIVIEGGIITAISGEASGAGIGSGKRHSCGEIIIRGGTVTAQGGAGAGIGTDEFGTCGNITISKGSVIARSDRRGAGIGSGDRGTCGTITITDGVSRVEASKGVTGDQIIGAGLKGTCGKVTIDGVKDPTPESYFEHFTSQILEYRYVSDTWLLERR